jgi:hypothetical protein
MYYIAGSFSCASLKIQNRTDYRIAGDVCLEFLGDRRNSKSAVRRKELRLIEPYRDKGRSL